MIESPWIAVTYYKGRVKLCDNDLYIPPPVKFRSDDQSRRYYQYAVKMINRAYTQNGVIIDIVTPSASENTYWDFK